MCFELGRATGGVAGRARVELCRRLDDDQRVAVRVAQPEHRLHRAAEARDLVVDVDAGGLQRGVIGVDVIRVEADPGLAAARLLALRRRGERDRRRGPATATSTQRISGPIGTSTTFSKPSVST